MQRILTGVLFSTVSAGALPVWGQEQSLSDDGAFLIEEITVTASRRSESLQDVPIAVTAFTGDTLAEQRVQTVMDMAHQVPGLQIKTGAGSVNPTIFIRGIGFNDFNANSTGAVAVYVDEVYLGSPAGQLFQFFDLERVEVLRGPQGTLYGRNTTGGAINVYSRRPGDAWEGQASLTYGRFNEVGLEAGIGGPVVEDRLGIRIAGVFNQRDGITLNRLTGEKVNDVDNWAARAIVEFTPTEDLEILLNINGGQSRADAKHFQHRGMLPVSAEFADASGLCAPAYFNSANCTDIFGYSDTDGDLYAGDYSLDGKEPVDVFGVSGTVKWDLGAVELTSISAYVDTARETLEDTDSGPASLAEGLYQADYWQFSQEIRLASSGGEDLDWMVGGYYYKDNIESDSYFDLLRDLRPLFMEPANPTGLSPENFVFLARYGYEQEVRTAAIFGQFDYRATDKITLHLGLRYTDEERSINYSTSFDESVLDGLDLAIPSDPRFPYINTTSFDDLSGSIGVDYQVNDDVLTYAKVSKGVKSGGFSGGLAFQIEEVEPFDDEELIAYEVGIKSDLFDRRMRLNMAAFYYDYSNLQVFTLVNRGGVPVQVLTNASDARVYGMEAELQARPLEGFDLSLGLSLLNSEYRDFMTQGGEDYSGNRLPAAPEASFNGAASYEMPLEGMGSLLIGADFSYQSKIYLETSNAERLSQDGYWLVNGRVGFRSEDEAWELTLWARNIFGKRYLIDVFDVTDFGFDQMNYADPGTYGLTLSLSY
ncbi:TonB-dependent receptor [Emcibacter sp.]|uniref:TonB-dependent receptor n=1 Tax=Emcibacter sp. TaxID=1979954 RepID=UPI003A91D587